MNSRVAIIGVVVILAVFALFTMPFTVEQTEQAIVLQFGRPVRVVADPGLHMKLPWQSIVDYDKRVLDFDLPAARFTASDQKQMIVDAYSRFRIVNPLLFYQTVGTEQAARTRLAPILSGVVRDVIGTVALADVVSGQREATMRRIRTNVNNQTKEFGIAITDVRLRRVDLPEANSQAIFSRMISERQREAAQYRADGDRQATEIRADADKQRTEILADAQKQAQILRGEGDADSIKIYADAFGKDKAFFAFYRSLEAYRTALAGQNTTFVLSPDDPFFRYFSAVPKGPVAGDTAPAAARTR
jgi:modulator of FtsH protease HflC